MHLKSVTILSAAVIILSCGNKNSTTAKASFCDTVCMQDSMKFIDNNNRLNPMFISAQKTVAAIRLPGDLLGKTKISHLSTG